MEQTVNIRSTPSENILTFQILAISGGGYRGLYTAEVLTRLEAQAGRPLGQCFDLISGTSVGGLLALAIAMEKPVAGVRDLFRDRGNKIFPPERRANHGWGELVTALWQPKYDDGPLRDVIEEVLGKDTLLGAASHRVVIPAVNMTKGSVQMFKTAHHQNFIRDHLRKASDIAMATSAAPTYFPLAEMDNAYFADGGLVANAPDMCALHEARIFLNARSEDVSILSIGATTTGFSLSRKLGRHLGKVQWMTRGRLFSTIVSAQQQLVDFMLKHQLEDRYLRIDENPGEEQLNDIALDISDKSAQGTLLGLAEGSHQKFATDPRLLSMLAHKPNKPTFFHGAA
jgi:patatin-like phospholipase/acyl hydrolase